MFFLWRTLDCSFGACCGARARGGKHAAERANLENEDEHVNLRLRKPVEQDGALERLRHLAAELLLLGPLAERPAHGRREGCELHVDSEAALLAEGGAGALAGPVPAEESGRGGKRVRGQLRRRRAMTGEDCGVARDTAE